MLVTKALALTGFRVVADAGFFAQVRMFRTSSALFISMIDRTRQTNIFSLFIHLG
jgi:hypothetical protein